MEKQFFFLLLHSSFYYLFPGKSTHVTNSPTPCPHPLLCQMPSNYNWADSCYGYFFKVMRQAHKLLVPAQTVLRQERRAAVVIRAVQGSAAGASDLELLQLQCCLSLPISTTFIPLIGFSACFVVHFLRASSCNNGPLDVTTYSAGYLCFPLYYRGICHSI